jgi:hypothetical protein
MDDSVIQAMAKWPNVPHCYGWLALDARGRWRMRDDRAQRLGLPGDVISNAALVGFINRNYLHDERGRWYFQNGPQRVYVTLEAAPFIAHTDPAHGFLLHTRQPLAAIERAWLTEAGNLLLEGDGKIAMVDDRDMAECMAGFRIDGAPAGDRDILDWVERPDHPATPAIVCNGRTLPLRRIARAALPERFGFVPAPSPDATSPLP